VILEVELAGGDPAALRAYYAEALGLPVVLDASGRFVVDAGTSRVAFHEAAAGSAPLYHLAFNVPENLFAEAKAWLAARSGLVGDGARDKFDFDFWNAHACYTVDPAGNVLELIAHHELPNAAGRWLGAESLLGVAEVGLPVPDVLEAAATLEAELGLVVWDGDPGPRFAAVGGRDGGFIAVPLGRGWMPTGAPAGPHPLEVRVASARPGAWAPDGLPYRIWSPGPS
jgi:catechol-2,3-dioxygenase